MDCNCKECPYRLAIARMADIHILREDCDKYGTEYCAKQSKPPRRLTMLNLDGAKPDHIPQDQWDRMKDNFERLYEESE